METAQYYQQNQPDLDLPQWPGTRVAFITREPPRFGTVTGVRYDGQLLVRFDGANQQPTPMPLHRLVLIASRGRRT